MTTPLSFDQWHDALRGQPQQPQHAQHSDIQLIRRMLAEHVARHTRPLAQITQQMKDDFIARAYREGVLRSQPGAAPLAQANSSANQIAQVALPHSAANQRWYKLAACIAVLGVALPLLWQLQHSQAPGTDTGPDATMRGGEQAQHITSPDPQAKANQIAQVLRSAGITPRIAGEGKRVDIQALVPAGAVEVRAQLAALGVEVPVHGRLNVRLSHSGDELIEIKPMNL